jgi:hypothetical protein
MKSSEGYSEGRPFRDDRLIYCGRHVMRTDRQRRGAAHLTHSGRPPSPGIHQFDDILRVQPTGAPCEDRSEAEELGDVRLGFTPQLLVLAVCFDKERRTALHECNR